MIVIKTFGKKADRVSVVIKQNEVHNKFCAQLYFNGMKANWYGWCDSVRTVDSWAIEQLEYFKSIQ